MRLPRMCGGCGLWLGIAREWNRSGAEPAIGNNRIDDVRIEIPIHRIRNGEWVTVTGEPGLTRGVAIAFVFTAVLIEEGVNVRLFVARQALAGTCGGRDLIPLLASRLHLFENLYGRGNAIERRLLVGMSHKKPGHVRRRVDVLGTDNSVFQTRHVLPLMPRRRGRGHAQ